MLFNPIPRQKPLCTMNDFVTFIKMLFNKSLIKGNTIQEFESQFAKVYGAKHALTASSCRSVFALIIDALGIEEGDEVILPAFNLSVFPNILVHKGIIPVFVDIDEHTLTIDVSQIEKNITPKTKAIVAVHLFGNCCNMDQMIPIAQKYKIFVIEDCANAYKTLYRDRYAGTYGDVACFSLSHSKDIPTFGGGILITNNNAIYSEIKRRYEKEFTYPSLKWLIKTFLKNLAFKIGTSKLIFAIFVYPIILSCALKGRDIVAHFIEDKDELITHMGKTRFSNFQAFLGIRKLNENNRSPLKRIKIADKFNRAFSKIKNITIPKTVEGGSHAYWNYTIAASDRASVLKILIRHGIDAKKITMYDCNHFKIFEHYRRPCPVSKKTAETLIALPMYHLLNEHECAHMIKTICDISGNPVTH